jgi:hypothetical protein
MVRNKVAYFSNFWTRILVQIAPILLLLNTRTYLHAIGLLMEWRAYTNTDWSCLTGKKRHPLHVRRLQKLRYQTSWIERQRSTCIRSCSVRIWADTLTILIEVSSSFHQFLRAIALWYLLRPPPLRSSSWLTFRRTIRRYVLLCTDAIVK